ncbi:DUF2256 domain-containing protein [Thalassotalea ganghwensis]
MHKRNLSEKVCMTCQRPFSWRKKWHKDWSNVKYCSKRCAGQRSKIRGNAVERH